MTTYLWQVAEKHNSSVTPAEAGVQKSQERLDSRLRGNDIKDLKEGFFSSLLVHDARLEISGGGPYGL